MPHFQNFSAEMCFSLDKTVLELHTKRWEYVRRLPKTEMLNKNASEARKLMVWNLLLTMFESVSVTMNSLKHLHNFQEKSVGNVLGIETAARHFSVYNSTISRARFAKMGSKFS